jgi:hypothetical protein
MLQLWREPVELTAGKMGFESHAFLAERFVVESLDENSSRPLAQGWETVPSTSVGFIDLRRTSIKEVFRRLEIFAPRDGSFNGRCCDRGCGRRARVRPPDQAALVDI